MAAVLIACWTAAPEAAQAWAASPAPQSINEVADDGPAEAKAANRVKAGVGSVKPPSSGQAVPGAIKRILGDALYTSEGELNTRPVHNEKTDATAHPYLKLAWESSTGTLVFHLYLNFKRGAGGGQTYARKVANGSSMTPIGSTAKDRSFAKLKKLAITGVQEVYTQDGFASSSRDFGMDLFNSLSRGMTSDEEGGLKYDLSQSFTFNTRLVVHQPGEAGLSADQQFLTVQVGGDAPQGCTKNWYSACVMDDLGMLGKSNALFLPWDHQANDERGIGRAGLTVGLELMAAHEFGHAFGLLKDAYPSSTSSQVPDRMLENSETSINTGKATKIGIGDDYYIYTGAKYSNLMNYDGNFIRKVGKKLAIRDKVLTANDVEMILWAYRSVTSQATAEPQRYNDWAYCFSGLQNNDDKYSCGEAWHDLQRSPVIASRTDKVVNGHR
jgi:hypothetical protein